MGNERALQAAGDVSAVLESEADTFFASELPHPGPKPLVTVGIC
jgi:hypothetical protein